MIVIGFAISSIYYIGALAFSLLVVCICKVYLKGTSNFFMNLLHTISLLAGIDIYNSQARQDFSAVWVAILWHIT